ncbi:MAG: sulfatase-like hydrolase/transferase [Dehalococcoidia bacterium]|nr:sulfatase-like hydrolase/transferase [Dehalococcoidia bacterium]
MLESRPNVVLIMPDQHRGSILGCAGEPVISTPNLDRIAAEGIRFSRTSSQSPLCQPARASFLTGRYPHQHGCIINERNFPSPEEPNFLHTLRAAGYHVAGVGKVHVGTVPRGEDRLSHLMQYGFNELDEATGKISFLKGNNRYTRVLAEAGVLDSYRKDMLERIAKMADDWPGAFLRTFEVDGVDRQEPWYAGPAPVPPELFIDNYVGRSAVEWIKGFDREQPFCLWVGFCGPHDPYDAPQEYANPYLARFASIPVGPFQPPEPTPSERYNRLLEYFGVYSGTGRIQPEHVRRLKAFYYANVSLIDDQIGAIQMALRERGFADNTWIVYTSDHGDMLGDHQMLSKVLMYKGALHVPLIIRPPGGIAGSVVDDPVELIDGPATILDGLGLLPVRDSHARSLLPYLGEGHHPAKRDAVFAEVNAFSAVVTEGFKYVIERDTGAPCLLFDLTTDPDENRNLAAESGWIAVRQELYRQFLAPFLAM